MLQLRFQNEVKNRSSSLRAMLRRLSVTFLVSNRGRSVQYKVISMFVVRFCIEIRVRVIFNDQITKLLYVGAFFNTNEWPQNSIFTDGNSRSLDIEKILMGRYEPGLCNGNHYMM